MEALMGSAPEECGTNMDPQVKFLDWLQLHVLVIIISTRKSTLQPIPAVWYV